MMAQCIPVKSFLVVYYVKSRDFSVTELIYIQVGTLYTLYMRFVIDMISVLNISCNIFLKSVFPWAQVK